MHLFDHIMRWSLSAAILFFVLMLAVAAFMGSFRLAPFFVVGIVASCGVVAIAQIFEMTKPYKPKDSL